MRGEMIAAVRQAARACYHQLFPRVVFNRYIRNHSGDEIEMDYLDVLVDRLRGSVDVGAHLGRYSVRLAELSKHVWAFEPHPRLARVLEKSLPRNVSVKQAAVSKEKGETSLRIPVKGFRQVESLATLEESAGVDDYRLIRVPVVTLDELATNDIGFVKIDVEGHEIGVIEGATKILASQRPVLLIEADEHHSPGTVAKLDALMTSFGYHGIFILRDEVRSVSEFDVATMQNNADLLPGIPRKACAYVNNFIFVPDHIHGSLRDRLLSRAQSLRASRMSQGRG